MGRYHALVSFIFIFIISPSMWVVLALSQSPLPLLHIMYREEEGRGGKRREEEGRGGKRRGTRTMRTSTCAAIGIIPELMNMHPPLSRRVVSLDLKSDNRGRLFRSLFEMHRSAHGGVPAENCYYRNCQPISCVALVR